MPRRADLRTVGNVPGRLKSCGGNAPSPPRGGGADDRVGDGIPSECRVRHAAVVLQIATMAEAEAS